MARVTTYQDSRPFVVQPNTLVYDTGRDIDWANTDGETTIPAGTAVVIIVASGKICPWATKPGSEAAAGILAAGADQNDRTGTPGHAMIIGGNLFENLLSSYEETDWADIKTSLNLLGTWVWQTYADSRAT
ncbi:MAG: hypothetical protein DRI46_08415 [Chloroflexi bacterium]|nr:MAG: hypothetical protein DRI46_08415 [Chloroflexota bacterium]